MVILRATSILGGQKEDKGMMCSITFVRFLLSFVLFFEFCSVEPTGLILLDFLQFFIIYIYIYIYIKKRRRGESQVKY
jgi:hypothetical protein